MKILLLIQTYRNVGNNANLISKVLPYLSENHSISILSLGYDENIKDLPTEYNGYPLYWATNENRSVFRKNVDSAISKVVDRNGYSDAVLVMQLSRKIKQLHKEHSYDAVITTMEPFSFACATLKLPKRVKKILYLMDPPANIHPPFTTTPYRERMLKKVLRN